MEFLKRHERWFLPLFLGVVFFAYQWMELPNYGVSWDEPLHRNWGKIFLAYWRTGDREILSLMPGNGLYYGPLFYALNYVLSEWLFTAWSMRFFEANHILTLLVATLSVPLVFLFGRLIGGRRAGFLAAIFFILFPPFLAHSHYNPKDIPLMTAVLFTAYVFFLALERPSRRLLLLSAFLMGVCITFKVSALLMAPVFGITYVTTLMRDRKPLSKFFHEQWKLWLTGMLSLFLGIYLFWPTAWGDLLLVPESISFFLGANFWPGKVLYLGQEYGGAELPWHYIPLEYLMTMPLVTIVSLLFGTIFFIYSLWKRERVTPGILLLLWIGVPLLASVRPGFVRYDSMRQFFFVLPAIAIVAGLGFDRMLRWVLGALRAPAWTNALCIVLLTAVLVMEAAVVHPFEGSYRNWLVRALYPTNMDHSFEIEYWGPTYRQGTQWLRENAELNPVICVPIAGILVTWYPWREDFTFECSDKAHYVMYFTRYSEGHEYTFLDREPVFRIQRMGADLLKIYKVK